MMMQPHTDANVVTPTPAAIRSPQVSNNQWELELVRRIVLRDRGALKELYLLYHRRLSRFLARVTRRQDLAEEIINDTLFVVWTSAHRFRAESRVSTWIVGIAYRRALKSVSRNRLEFVDLENADAILATDSIQNGENQDWIERAVAELPIEQRLCLELAYVLGHSCEEIGEITSCSVNTVKTRLFHARRKLRISLPRLAGMDE
jgi:RNA polymerase sigma-70 factor, ECF subfamily